MGKTKNKRGYKGKSPAVSPITNEILGNDTDSENENRKMDYLDKILETICSSLEFQQKECALSTFANLAQDKQAVLKMLQKGVVKKLGPLLADLNPAVKEKVAGTFRNMSVSGEEKACELMVKHDIMTCIGLTIKKDILELDQLIKSDGNKEIIANLSSSLKELIILLWNLCEASSVAIELFNKDQLLMPIASLLYAENQCYALFLASAQCLYTVTEDNKEAIERLISNTALLERLTQMQEQLGNGKQMIVASLASGILFNLHTSLPEGTWNKLMEKIVFVISQVLDFKVVDIIQRQAVSSESNEIILDHLSAQQICLELLANILCNDDDDDDEWEDMEVISEDDMEENVEEIQLDMNEMSTATAELPIFKMLITQSIPSKVLVLIENPNKDAFLALKNKEIIEGLLKACTRVRKSALVCLNNLLSECPMSVIGDPSCLETLWVKTMEIATSHSDDVDEELMDAYTGLLRAIIVKMADTDCRRFLSQQTIEIFNNWYMKFTNDSTRCNLLSILGVAGKCFALTEDGLPVLEGIGRILRSAINIHNSVVVITEALDAIFDAFAEGSIADSVLVSTDLTKELCRLPSLLKSKMKAEKNTLKEHLPVIDMARTNLIRFIKYKQWK